jgi:hypothetical protein
VKLEKTLYTMDDALFQIRLAHQILAHAEHSRDSTKAISELMADPIEKLTVCLEKLIDKA